MLDADTLLMKRALELARRGAGLVSPNPMVGALLVNEGRSVGEGFHRYDLLRHAEAKALEQAGPLARGATLYCNLEPCSHHGRTPPCTDALIEAGIARAVIATRDPDRRVNGRGIEQLRQAGIEVEVGLLEDRALRLNECYFKYITSGVAFVHGLIEYPLDGGSSSESWSPSQQFLRMASEYDAVLMGKDARLNKLVIEAGAGRERHRALLVVGGESEQSLLKNLPRRLARKLSVVRFEDQADREGIKKVVRLDEALNQGVRRSQVGAVLATLGRMQVSSVLALPGIFDVADPPNFEEFDKLTLAIPRAGDEQAVATQWSLGNNIQFDLEDVTAVETAGYIELTGYPSLRGVA
jgi:pyrimidine deaminase RibD-like protein